MSLLAVAERKDINSNANLAHFNTELRFRHSEKNACARTRKDFCSGECRGSGWYKTVSKIRSLSPVFIRAQGKRPVAAR